MPLLKLSNVICSAARVVHFLTIYVNSILQNAVLQYSESPKLRSTSESLIQADDVVRDDETEFVYAVKTYSFQIIISTGFLISFQIAHFL